MDELSGALVERVGVEAWVDGRGDAGEVAGFWQPGVTVFAAVVPDPGGGASEGGARRSRRRWRVTLRAPVAVSLTSQLRWRSEVLAVLAVESDPRRSDRVVLRCEVRP
ncbi:hypothetical protein GCM10011529_01060 [Polymorphobacter glacialis]|uniref:Head-tail adaptor protein n=1 Tax=Sandarakinorhabdus glacialis TaxID=1614636 RepID=A0A916ZIX1_9SPHN|nr:head-tail adaptor protein [Polymorphobacter glacialis]GGD98757.1 hypothetical protein GCM10011529_01060 [Polymorphobacter glacialis]